VRDALRELGVRHDHGRLAGVARVLEADDEV